MLNLWSLHCLVGNYLSFVQSIIGKLQDRRSRTRHKPNFSDQRIEYSNLMPRSVIWGTAMFLFNRHSHRSCMYISVQCESMTQFGFYKVYSNQFQTLVRKMAPWEISARLQLRHYDVIRICPFEVLHPFLCFRIPWRTVFWQSRQYATILWLQRSWQRRQSHSVHWSVFSWAAQPALLPQLRNWFTATRPL